MDNGPSMKFWLSGFFFTDAFIRGVLQNFARKYRIPIDTICFDFIRLPEQGDHEKIPEDGLYIYGMFLEGAHWDNEHMMLAKSFDKITAAIQHSQRALTQLANRILICRKF